MSLLTDAKVVKQMELAPHYYRLVLSAPATARAAGPGQFLHVRCGETLEPLLRRPLSIHAVNRERGELALLYRVAGRGTALLAKKKGGDTISIMGPLGRGYTMPSAPERVAVVAGGIGIAPLYFLLQETGARGQSALVFWGTSTKEQFFRPARPVWDLKGTKGRYLSIVQEIRAQGHQIVLATDDGSAGFHGTVTDLFERYLNNPSGREEILSLYGEASTTSGQIKTDREAGGGPGAGLNFYQNPESETFARVYGCGPGVMMKELCRIIGTHKIPGEISLEERMGCGVGACLACACKTREGDQGGFRYSRVCVEGPVFPAGEVIWDD
ncbi:MAG TPA: dihydroorotate dehydrogenase electron transfer subunit [Bacillota bacterium]|nr:dihydroorotate dehydrogenase electron transfer subunit [Peptococcaceae bacterium MAG4]HPZ43787.1 dihydroorotate dehydrogenase electron transfer subunit [Bacillota bacterium]HQD76289.1 dihydroorotate dehydrogenase electron transfer subunit [Bacillota bacterium]HUM58991.1 dihydroorotate dehydrogenase electron transfer subunit [Bacillota bacterium]